MNMAKTNLEALDKQSLNSTAFIFYTPSSIKKSQKIFFNQEALQILSMSYKDKADGIFNPDLLSSLCSNWMKLLKTKISDKNKEKNNLGSKPVFLTTIKSYRREYTVQGVLLSSYNGGQKSNSYIFIIQRLIPEDLNLLKISRMYQLSQREQQIIKLLLKGEGNKQIAFSLGLSSNTIKSYMKILMRKLGVQNRSGLIAAILGE